MRSTDLATTSGFVLIGGQSRRLGMDKASYPIGGIPAADLLASRLEKVCDGGVVLVGRDRAPWSSYESVPDSRSGFGPISGLLTALEHCDSEYAFVLATDLWNVTSAGIQSILHGITDNGHDLLSDVAYAATQAGRGQPLCSVWRVRSTIEIVRRRIGSGELSIFGLLGELHSTSVTLGDVQLRNVNEPQDLESFLRQVVDER
ncbi:MAG: molybdenum cofactor guanylyltransferase [Actinomycetota bacterium]